MQKIKNIEFLRVLLISAVLAIHTCSSGSFALYKHFPNIDLYKTLHDFFVQTNNSVEGFFIVAGFLLVLTFKNTETITNFIKKKYIRFTPVIIFTTVIAIILSCFGVLKCRIFGDILTVLLLNHFGICIATGSLPVLWFTSALFAGLLLYFVILKKLSGEKLYLTLIFFVFVSYLILEILQHGNFSHPHKNYYHIFNIGFLRSVGDTGLGVLTGLLYKNCLAEKLKPAGFLTKTIFTVLELTFLTGIIWWLFCPHKIFNSIFFVILFTGLLILFVLRYGIISDFLNNDIWVKIGKYQYSIYVTHSVIGFLLLNKIWLRHPEFMAAHPVIPIVSLNILIIICGILAYHMVELPCGKYLKEKYEKR